MTVVKIKKEKAKKGVPYKEDLNLKIEKLPGSNSTSEQNKQRRKKCNSHSYFPSLRKENRKFIKNKLISNTQQKFKSERHKAFTEDINKWCRVFAEEINMWCRGIVVITTAQLHLTKPELRFCKCSNPACSYLGDSRW